MPDMLLTGAFAHIDNVMFDWSVKKKDVPHDWVERNQLLKKLKVPTFYGGFVISI